MRGRRCRRVCPLLHCVNKKTSKIVFCPVPLRHVLIPFLSASMKAFHLFLPCKLLFFQTFPFLLLSSSQGILQPFPFLFLPFSSHFCLTPLKLQLTQRKIMNLRHCSQKRDLKIIVGHFRLLLLYSKLLRSLEVSRDTVKHS